AHEGLDERGQGQDRVFARRAVRQIRHLAGGPGGVRAGRQRRDGNLDFLPGDPDVADRRHEREGGGDGEAHRAIDVGAGTPDQLPYISIALTHSGYNAGVTVAEIDLRFLSDYLGDAQLGRLAFAYVIDSRGQVLASSTKGPDIGNDLSALPQVAARLAPGGTQLTSGDDTSGHAVLTTSSTVPKLSWF